jgi:two-component system sensor histidine kinase ChvG
VSRAARWLSGIRFRLLAFNALLVFLPAAGVLFLDTFERRLLSDQERTMVEQGRVLAATLSDRGPLEADEVKGTLVRLEQRTGARIRVVDREGQVIADSSLLGPRREANATPVPASGSVQSNWLYRAGAVPFRLYRRYLAPPEPPLGSADAYRSGEPLTGREVRAALAGRYGAATRISSGGQRSVTLYSAVPVRDGSRIVGAVVVAQSTYRILEALYEVRIGVFSVFLASLSAAVVLSLLVSQTIARPLARLRDQAEAVLDRRGRLSGRFEGAGRRDEIGELASALEELRRRLERHIRYVEAFASDVSHEFKNPLASIRTATEMLAEAGAPDEKERFLDLIQREVARMEHMLSDVHEVSRLDAGSDADEREPVDLAELLAGVVEAERLRGRGRPLLEAPGSPVVVLGSPERISRVFENLLDNAVGLSPVQAAAEVSLRSEGAEAVVRVEDRGPGIPDAHLERIFSRFFSYRPKADAERHTGLGLSIVKAIVENEGGTVRASNRPSGGACFEVRLPLAPGRG